MKHYLLFMSTSAFLQQMLANLLPIPLIEVIANCIFCFPSTFVFNTRRMCWNSSFATKDCKIHHKNSEKNPQKILKNCRKWIWNWAQRVWDCWRKWRCTMMCWFCGEREVGGEDLNLSLCDVCVEGGELVYLLLGFSGEWEKWRINPWKCYRLLFRQKY